MKRNTPASAPTATANPEVVKKMAELTDSQANAMIEVLSQLLSSLDALRTSGEKANTAFISYMDRVVLLSGATLTLTFSVLGNLSNHLYQDHVQANSASLILGACWLLVATILFALIFNVISINIQHKSDLHFGLQIASTKMKLSVLTATSNPEVVNIPDLVNPDIALKDLKMLRIFRYVAGVLVQVSIFSAFVSLAVFIQKNLPVLLNLHK